MELSKRKKNILMSIEIVLALTLLFFAVSELAVTRYRQTEIVYYAYNSKGSIDYKVYLTPNIMFNERYLKKDRYYVLKYIDYIDMEFKYEYTSNLAAQLNVEYSVIGYLQGLHGKDNEVLWSK